MTDIQKERRKNITIVILILALVILLGIFFNGLIGMLSACNSKSGQLDKIVPEKCVIISEPLSYTTDIGYKYKVNRFEKGVVDIITDWKLWTKGDTIFHKFPN
jgi:hypothetical protein